MAGLSEMDVRDQFEIIRHENNEAAIFCHPVLLVEGPSDRTHIVLIAHIAHKLNPQWDFDKRGAAIAKADGQSSIEGYRSFLQRFEMRVAVAADLDALLDGFDKLGSSGCRSPRDSAVCKLDLIFEAFFRSAPPQAEITEISQQSQRRRRRHD
ncbi:TOPRIM nucleotidyl transferase/hydrolase domain-containing protein [Streptomyces kanamyceticus]|uniref:TOPRIM nucleotidyl transferase/hydrolase domain-containing protein n=1 Tax=Streptomyces kanamyceticus TaxID=1967 RepID=UPI0037DCC96C